MGFLKKLFGGERASTNTKVSQTPVPQASGNKYENMSCDDKLLAWGRINDIRDTREKLGQMSELAETGFGVACFSMAEAYMNLGIETGNVLWPKINHWLQRAIDADIPMAHYYKAFTSMNEENPEYDVDRGITEYCLAAMKGVEPAIQRIYDYCHTSDPEVAEANTAIFQKELEPYVEELLQKESEQAWNALGMLYFYGVYFERNFNMAKAYFTKSNNSVMLSNPVFVEDDDDDEDED